MPKKPLSFRNYLGHGHIIRKSEARRNISAKQFWFLYFVIISVSYILQWICKMYFLHSKHAQFSISIFFKKYKNPNKEKLTNSKVFSCKIKSVLKYNNKRCLPKLFQLKSFGIWCQILLLFLLSFSLNSAIINSLTRDFQGGSHDDEASSRKNERTLLVQK